ncbi:MAG TPA: glycoside hydrolase family 3 N-terminal domain-containing protein [Pseudonocardiaceae bacterium]
MTRNDPLSQAVEVLPRWRDPALPVPDRVDALLAEMTLAEKIGQLGSRWIGNDPATSDETDQPAESLPVAPSPEVLPSAGLTTLEQASRYGLGHLTRVYGSRPVTVEEGTAQLVTMQHTVLHGTRLGIPALVHEECLTGFTTYGATVYPAPIAWAATFDPDLLHRLGAAIGRDLRAVGVHQGLAPVLDVVRDPRWGRVEETMGEDPYLVATLGSAYVSGLEAAGVVATLKHFAGYSASRAARNHAPAPIGRRELMDMILPPFETAIAVGGARSVMNAYCDVDGVPAGADSWLLTDLLRDEWGFTGTVVSDYYAIAYLATMHKVAADIDEAGVQALTAGVDVELPNTDGFGQHLAQRVHAGELSESTVDRAVRRILTQKIQLGLLDPGWSPETSIADATADLDSPENHALAGELAQRSIVLLDAGSALPLIDTARTAPGKIAMIGPCAADPHTLMGCYAFPNHVLPRYPDMALGIDVPTLVEALRNELPDTEIVHEPGCATFGDDKSGFAAATEATYQADLCVAVVGDRAGLFGNGTSGEGCDAEDLRLPGVQADLLDALFATGTPVIVVVVSGRPYALGDVHTQAAGLVQAFMPGQQGAAAIAGVLAGRINPGGKLPVQIPRRAGGQPATYLHPPLGGNSNGISSIDPTPLFPFGYGGSYTRFELDDLDTSATEIPTDGELDVTVRLRNTGTRPGDEVIQLYLHDPVAQVTRPVRQLIGFARVRLEPGEGVQVRFHLHADRTAFTGRDLRRIVEPGEIELLVGTSSADVTGTITVRLTGGVRVVGHHRQLTTPVDVRREDLDATHG